VGICRENGHARMALLAGIAKIVPTGGPAIPASRRSSLAGATQSGTAAGPGVAVWGCFQGPRCLLHPPNDHEGSVQRAPPSITFLTVRPLGEKIFGVAGLILAISRSNLTIWTPDRTLRMLPLYSRINQSP